MNYRNCYIVILLILLCGVGAYAEEVKKPIEVNGDQVEFLPNQKKVMGTGNVSIDYEDIKLTCDKITVDTQTKDAEAEGHVVLKMPTGELRGERISFNFDTKKGEILNARAQSGEWFGFGEKIEILSRDSYRVINGYITSCNLPHPHYKISSKSVRIYPGNKVVAENVVMKAGKVPVLFLPKYNYSLKADWPTVDMVPGKKKKWGFFALNSYRYQVNEHDKLTLRLDERQNWGFAEGLDYKYSFPTAGQGLLRTYYTNQRDRDRNEPLKAEEQRWRAQLRHRWDINSHTTAILEYHKLGDVGMTKDFFYREEYEREKSPESYIYALDKHDEYSLGFLMRKRVNRFQTVTERLPESRFDLKDQQLLDMPLYFKTDTSFASLNQKTGNSGTDLDVVRFDTYNKLSAPLRIYDFLSIMPFAGIRDTAYTRDANSDEGQLRSAFYTGIDVSTKLARTYDVSGNFLGVDFSQLHHIVTPTLKYQYIHEPSIPYLKLQQFDDVDSLDRTSKFELGLENKLKTKRIVRGNLTSVDMGYFLITSDYLYKPEGMGSQFSNVKGDLELTPFDWLRFESDTLYDPETHDFQTWNSDIYIEEKDEWSFGFGSRYWQNEESELTSELFYKLNSQWSFRTFGRYDLKEVEDDGHKIINQFKDKELTVIKDLHCWIAEMSVSVARDGGTTFWFVMKLKASPNVPFDFKDYYPAPKR